MPLYEYQCKACEHYFTSMQSIDNLAVPTRSPCPECGAQRVEKIITGAPGLADPVRLGRIRPDDGFKEVLKKIHENNPGSSINNNSRYI